MQNLGIIFLISIMLSANFGFAAGDKFNSLNTLNQVGIQNFKFKLPFGFDPRSININTNIPITSLKESSRDMVAIPNIDLKQFLTPKNISSGDLGEAAKAVITLVIEIFLVVISITSQVLKLILEFLR